jgi:hypothetical protein
LFSNKRNLFKKIKELNWVSVDELLEPIQTTEFWRNFWSPDEDDESETGGTKSNEKRLQEIQLAVEFNLIRLGIKLKDEITLDDCRELDPDSKTLLDPEQLRKAESSRKSKTISITKRLRFAKRSAADPEVQRVLAKVPLDF